MSGVGLQSLFKDLNKSRIVRPVDRAFTGFSFLLLCRMMTMMDDVYSQCTLVKQFGPSEKKLNCLSGVNWLFIL